MLTRTLPTSLDEALRPCAPSDGRDEETDDWLDACDSVRARTAPDASAGGTGEDLAEVRAETEDDLAWVLLTVDELALACPALPW